MAAECTLYNIKLFEREKNKMQNFDAYDINQDTPGMW